MSKVKDLIEEFKACQLIKVFEFEVMDIKTNEKEWITFNIDQNCNYLTADPSEDIKREVVRWDGDFSLDSHLEALHEQCTSSIDESDDWEIIYEN